MRKIKFEHKGISVIYKMKVVLGHLKHNGSTELKQTSERIICKVT